MKLELVKASKKYNREQLFTLRALLAKAIDPLHAAGTDFHGEIMKCLRTVKEKNVIVLNKKKVKKIIATSKRVWKKTGRAV